MLSDHCLSCVSATLMQCGQTFRWIKMKLGMLLDLGPGRIVLDGYLAPLRRKGGRAPPPFFCPFLLWLNGWMHQDATWYGGRPQLRRLCVRWGPSSPPLQGHSPPNFRRMSVVRCDQTTGWTMMALGTRGRPRPRRLCVRWGPSYPQNRGHTHHHPQPPSIWPMFIVAKRLDG